MAILGIHVSFWGCIFDHISSVDIMPGSSFCVLEIVPFTNKNLPEGIQFSYLEDQGICIFVPYIGST